MARASLLAGLRAMVAAVLALGCLCDASAAEVPGRPNFLVYFMDTMRADHAGCYGYRRLHLRSLVLP